MKVSSIIYNDSFEKQFIALPLVIQQKALKCEELLRQNPFHPSLRLHKLSGKLKDLWSVSIDKKYRIIFKVMLKGEVFFLSVGLHSIYH